MKKENFKHHDIWDCNTQWKLLSGL